MKKLSDILLEAENIVLVEEEVATNTNTIVPPVTSSSVDRVGNALQKLDQIGAMADDLYNTISHLEEIDAETDAALTGAYNSVDDLYAKIDDKYDVIPIDLDEYDVTEDLDEAFNFKAFIPDVFTKNKDKIISILSKALGYYADANVYLSNKTSDNQNDMDHIPAVIDGGETARKAFKLAKSLHEECDFDEDFNELTEKLSPDAPASEWIDDFVKSDAPQFKGKSKKERIKMALGAYYGAQKNEEVELEEAETYNLNHAQSFWYKLNKGAVSNIQKDKYLAALQKAIKAGDLTYKKDETMAKFTNMADRYDLKFKDKSYLTVWLHDNGAKISGNGNIYSRKGGALFSPDVKQSQIKLAEDVELEESFRPGHDMVPAPIGKDTYKADGLRKLWGIKMRAGKWADTFVGMYDDGKIGIINDQGVNKYSSVAEFEKGFAKFRKSGDLDENVDIEESVNLPKIKELVSLALIDEKDVPATIAALKATQSDKALTPAQTKLLGNLAVMLTNVILGDTSALSSVKRASKE